MYEKELFPVYKPERGIFVQITLQIAGVSCKECTNAIIRFVSVIPHVIDVQFTDDFQQMVVRASENIPSNWLRMAVEEAGYTLAVPEKASQINGGIHA